MAQRDAGFRRDVREFEPLLDARGAQRGAGAGIGGRGRFTGATP
jgi:hypothetical protein